MNYSGIFKARYTLTGKDWVRRIDPEDLRAFVSIGMEANLHGVTGGRKLAQVKGREYMSKIGRIGAIVANSKRAWRKAVIEESYNIEILLY